MILARVPPVPPSVLGQNPNQTMPNQTGIAGDDFYDLLEANRTLTRQKKLGTPRYPLRGSLS